MSERRRRAGRALIGAALAVLALALTACGAAEPAVAGQRVLVITDERGGDAGSAWYDLVRREPGLQAQIDAVAGSGYLTASPSSVADRAAAAGGQFDAVVLALGGNDVTTTLPTEVREALVRDAMSASARYAPRVIVLPPFGVTAADLDAWDETLRTAATQTGATFTPIDLPAGSEAAAQASAIAAAVVLAVRAP